MYRIRTVYSVTSSCINHNNYFKKVIVELQDLIKKNFHGQCFEEKANKHNYFLIYKRDEFMIFEILSSMIILFI